MHRCFDRPGRRAGRVWHAPAGLALACALLWARVAGAEIDRDEFVSADDSVQMIVPEGWVLSPHGTYADTLVVAVRRDSPGRMSLAVAALPPGTSLRQYVDQSRAVLLKLRFLANPPARHPSGAYLLDAGTPDRKTLVRQAYREHAGQVYILTMALPAALMPAYQDGFDLTLHNMRLSEPRGPKTGPSAPSPPNQENPSPETLPAAPEKPTPHPKTGVASPPPSP